MSDIGLVQREPHAMLLTDGDENEIPVAAVALVDDSGTRISTLPVSEKLTTRTVTGTSVSVGMSNTSVLAQNLNRKTVTITNTSAVARVSLAFGGTAVLDTGVTLMPGGTFTMDSLAFSTAAVSAISSGTVTLSVAEWV